MSEDIDLAIRLMGVESEHIVLGAKGLFDNPARQDQARAFLASDRDYLWFAFLDGTPVGFVSATVVLHPDKPPHLFVNELATHEAQRRKGIATRLIETVLEFGKRNGAWPVWLAAEGDDRVAQEFYRSLSGLTERRAVVFEWE